MFKKILFQLHWFIGITAGTVLMVVGLSGAILSFREELLNLLNPSVTTLATVSGTRLTPDQLVRRLQASQPDQRVTQLTVFADPHVSARVNFAPPPGVKRGELRYLDPVTGDLLPPLKGNAFFQFVERLHRWLLVTDDIGKVLTGSAALCLTVMALSGLYLRWPRRPLAWRSWITLDFSRSGRAFLWNLHSVLGTWALLMYLVFSLTGAYMAFDWFKDGANRLAGESPHTGQMPAMASAGKKKTSADSGDHAASHSQQPSSSATSGTDLVLTWQVFLQETAKTGGYSSARLRLPERPGKPVQITYLDAHPAHERANNQMMVQPLTGKITRLERYADKSGGGRLLSSVYPLHMGSYFGLPGRIVMTFAALGLPLFGITGWLLYLDRRRKKRAVQAERAGLVSGTGVVAAGQASSLLIAFASQSGAAESIALRSAKALQAAGLPVSIQSLTTLDPERLRHFHRVLLVASTFGEGDPPDSARRFARLLARQSGPALPHLQYGILALGDRNFEQFCGFGHTLEHWLQSQGAQALFPMIEVDNGDSAALTRWQQALSELAGVATTLDPGPLNAGFLLQSCYQPWRLAARQLLNPGSQGDPIFHLEFSPPEQFQATWPSGALAEVSPRHAVEQVDVVLLRLALDGATVVRHGDRQLTLADLLSRSVLPHAGTHILPTTAQQLADQLQPLGTRRYSIASIPEDGRVHLLVRQISHEDGLGLASGWLTEHAPLDSEVDMRLLPNPGFELNASDAPCIFIGNGSGLAGLRGHLRARAQNRLQNNWLLFGERNHAHDFLYRDEIERWLADGILSRADFAFSRDQPERFYVQDRLRAAADIFRKWIHQGAIIYVCGSLDGMAAGIDGTLTEILGQATLDDLIAAGRYRRDVY